MGKSLLTFAAVLPSWHEAPGRDISSAFSGSGVHLRPPAKGPGLGGSGSLPGMIPQLPSFIEVSEMERPMETAESSAWK